MSPRAVVAACALSVSAVPALADTIRVVRTFSVPGSSYTFPQGINNRGDIVTHAIVGDQNRDWTYLNRKWTALPAGQGAQGINERQQMAGSNTQYGFSQGSILNGSRVTLFHPEDAVWTIATGINNLGHVAGGYGTGDLPVSQTVGHGYVFANGDFTILEFPGALGTAAHSLNDAGDVVGYYSFDTAIPHVVDKTKTVHGFVYRHGGEWEEIDYPGAATTYALGINNRGDVVGFYFEANGASHAFVKTARGYFAVDFPTSWTQAYGINDLGQIVGRYYDAGVSKGFIAVIRPDGN